MIKTPKLKQVSILAMLCLSLLGSSTSMSMAGQTSQDIKKWKSKDIIVPLPKKGIVQFAQLEFTNEQQQLQYTDWGKFLVNRSQLARSFGDKPLYINVFYPSETGETLWMVENLYVPSMPDKGKTYSNWISKDIDIAPDARQVREVVRNIEANVVVSLQPLPYVQALVRLAEERGQNLSFRVRQIEENTGGWLGDERQDNPPSNPIFSIGEPPQPSSPPFEPDFNFAAPIHVYQATQPNIQSARNQCVPIAYANTLGFLERRVNNLPLNWDLPHIDFFRGRGQIVNFGDVFNWQAVPEDSLVANIDRWTQRLGVFDQDSGSSSSTCDGIRGVMSYLNTNGLTADFWHQGRSDDILGAGGDCDIGLPNSNIGDLFSTPAGEQPTWSWIFEQLNLGRGVSIAYGRYDSSGARTGGHMLRVWGASEVNGKRYLHVLDDGNQGSNNDGLQLQQFEVEDIGSPGIPGVSDGRLNIDGRSWEIEFAISINARPSLLIP